VASRNGQAERSEHGDGAGGSGHGTQSAAHSDGAGKGSGHSGH
jgi:hypothetical protein